MSPLTPGSTARIYRDGTLVAPAFEVPAEGRVELRGLHPGQYELRDECGGSVLVEVTHDTEIVRVGEQGEDDGPVAAADSTRQEPDAVILPEPEPVHPPAQDPADVDPDEVDGEWRVSLPASDELEQAGSPGEQPSDAVTGNFGAMNVAQLRDALREKGEKVSGKRGELIARLEGRDGSA